MRARYSYDSARSCFVLTITGVVLTALAAVQRALRTRVTVLYDGAVCELVTRFATEDAILYQAPALRALGAEVTADAGAHCRMTRVVSALVLLPVFKHDCDACVYCGRHEGYDLYYCPEEKEVILRHGDAGAEYRSYALDLVARLEKAFFRDAYRKVQRVLKVS